VGHAEASFRCIGGVDSDPAAIRDFGRLAGVPGTVLDLFDRPQYRGFHQQDPPEGWREAGPDDIRRAAGGERPHIVFGSAPCKGFSGLLSSERAGGERYQALNQLAIRGLWLALEAWSSDPPEFFLWENVPRIATRGRQVLDQMIRLLETYGYAVAETTHDCGELGNLAQSRKRFLLVARHREKVPPFLYEPAKRPLRGVGEVIGAFPLPGDPAAGPMHRMRELQWKTWVRLAFVEAGGDWRSLEKLRIIGGHLADFGIAPAKEWHRGTLGVCPWEEPAGTVTGAAMPTTGPFSVADPRVPSGSGEYSQLGVTAWDRPSGSVTGQSAPGGGRYAVADPRCAWHPGAYRNKLKVVGWDRASGAVIGARGPDAGAPSVADPRLGHGPRGPHFNNVYRVIRFDQPAPTVTAGTSPSSGGLAVADPRAGTHWQGKGKYRVTKYEDPAGTVIAASTTGNGAFAVADPRSNLGGGAWPSAGGAYGVIPWAAPSGAVGARAGHDNGRYNVADPRVDARCAEVLATDLALPAAEARLVAVIRALDGTWHRPFTTLELAALQGLVEAGEELELAGTADSHWRERIGNAVPGPAAAAIASVMGTTLLLAWAGETFALGSTPIWVRPIAVALSVAQPESIS
jgi:site-specific DNA-cytosine methylase